MTRGRDLLDRRNCFVVQTASFIFVCSVLIASPVRAFICKFPNEGCDVNKGKECCSGKCIDAHPGTNPRCTKSSLHNSCLYTYQCDDRLKCGTNNTCCSKYWGTCTHKRDCCDPQHSCFEVDGFYYKRCLYANSDSGYRGSFGGGGGNGFVGGSSHGCVVARQLMMSVLVLVVSSLAWTIATGAGAVSCSGGGREDGDDGGCDVDVISDCQSCVQYKNNDVGLKCENRNKIVIVNTSPGFHR